MSAHATGHVRTLPRKGGDVYFAKLRIPRPDGTVFEPQRRLGKVWTRRTRPPAGFLTRAQAEARLQAILEGDDIAISVEAPRDVVTFRAACDEYLRYLEFDKQRKRSTVKDVRGIVDKLAEHFGASAPVESITTADVDAFKDARLRQVSHATVRKNLMALSGVFGRAKRKGWIAENPYDNAERVTVLPSDDFNVLSVEQVHAVSREASEVLRAMILVAAFTGLRMGELLALRWRHVDFANRILHVQRNYVEGVEDTPKSHRRRSVPLSDQAVVALDSLSRRDRFSGPDDLVFGTETGGYANDDETRDGFYAALDAADLGYMRELEEPIVFHDLRHTFGTLCAAQGIEILKIKAWMGHSDIQTTMRYLHYVPQHDDAARLTAAFGVESVPPAVPRTTDIGV